MEDWVLENRVNKVYISAHYTLATRKLIPCITKALFSTIPNLNYISYWEVYTLLGCQVDPLVHCHVEMGCSSGCGCCCCSCHGEVGGA